MYLDNVSSLLAINVTEWCRKVPKCTDVREMFKSCLCPENVEGLQPVKINESIYKILPARVKVADQKIRGITTFITRSLGPLLPIFENLCKIEGECSGDPSSIKIGKSEFDIKQWWTNMGNSIHLSCYSLAILTQRRKANIHPFLDPKFTHLTHDTNPVSMWLLGNNLDESIASSSKVVVDVVAVVYPYLTGGGTLHFTHILIFVKEVAKFGNLTKPHTSGTLAFNKITKAAKILQDLTMGPS